MTDITALDPASVVDTNTKFITSAAELVTYPQLKTQVAADIISDTLPPILANAATDKALSQLGAIQLIQSGLLATDLLAKANNLSDLDDVPTALINLGIVASTELIAGILPLANTAEALAGVNDTKAITALKLQQVLNNNSTLGAAIRFNASGSPTILASKNISSLTRVGSGQYRLNFTAAMPNANYYVTAVCAHTSYTPMIGVVSALTTSLEVKTEKWDNASFTGFPDLPNISILVFNN